jgi:hypothetical protein
MLHPTLILAVTLGCYAASTGKVFLHIIHLVNSEKMVFLAGVLQLVVLHGGYRDRHVLQVLCPILDGDNNLF